MDSNTMQRMRAHITNNEGSLAFPYKDNTGKLTVGTGFKVDDEKTFVAMPFQIKDPKTGEPRPATEVEKKAEFLRARGLSNTQLQSDAGKSPLSLPEPEINRRLDSEITTRIDKIKGEVGGDNWDRLTPGQQTAVLDVHYANGSLDKFSNLKDGITTGDTNKIAENVDFHSGGARNWDRLARNRAETQGISFDEAKRQVEADRQAGKFDLPAKPEKTAGQSAPPTPSGQPPERTPAPSPEPAPEPQPQPAPPPASTPQSEPKPEPAPAPAPTPPAPETAPEPKKPDAPAPSPQAKAMMEMSASPIDNPGKSALLKPVDKLTEGEMKDMIASAQGDYGGWRSGDPLKAHTYEKVQDWHVAMYGDGQQTYDGGKPVEPTPTRPIPEQVSPHTTPQGEDLWQATGRMGQKVADAAGADNLDDAVKGLQRGLNILNEANPLLRRSEAYGPYTTLEPVAEDGKYGPQTDFAMKHATARLGVPKVEEAFALGRFNAFARNAQQTGNADGLEDKSHAIFGSLFRAPADAAAPKVEGGVLQETLNDHGADLKVDNWIGPKTTQAFGDILKDIDADAFTRSFGRGLGLM